MRTALSLLFLPVVALAAAPSPSPDQLQFFEQRIRPVLAKKCYECHSAKAEKIKGGLVLDSRAGIRKGGETGPAVVPGDAGKSLLLTAIRHEDKDMEMPPKELLSAEVIADFEKWITMGAPDPRENTGGSIVGRMTAEEAKQFWSFQPVRSPAPPELKDKSWPWTEVDRFVRAAQEAKGTRPVADADRMSLVRRLYFDLIGLPPSPEQVTAFLADKDSNAVEKLVDTLLRSPQFGERWGRHWLDVARYGESSGRERNYPFPEAWRYRDYVIASFNADKPYDQFIREQVAGDLLPVRSAAERNELTVATTFLAIGPKSLGEKNKTQFRLDLIDEQIDATTKAVLGLTVACARCHDHKFDPLTMKDYYAMAGIFLSTRTCYGTGGVKSRNASPMLPLVDEHTPAALASVKPTATDDDGSTRAKKRKNNGKKKKASGPVKVEQPSAGVPVIGRTMGVREGEVEDSPFYERGEPTEPRKPVPRGLVTTLPLAPATPIPQGQSGRLQLAQWLTAPENPLTARVMVNRVWQELFGAGIVATADNFGVMGARPTNGPLLDHLAASFIRNGWSMKKLVRSIVLSHAYQLSSDRQSENETLDPGNETIWHASQRRLDAESVRDAVLTITAQIDLTPPHGSAVQTLPDSDLGKGGGYSLLQQDSTKRSVYLPIIRDHVPDMLELFDFAEPSLVTASRDVTHVPSQALFMMNSDFIDRQSNIAARILMRSPMSDAARVDAVYFRMLCRPANVGERTRALQFLDHMGKQGGAAERGWTALCQALFASAEFRFIK